MIANSYDIDFRENTREFVRHLRNACCHYGIIIESKNNEISNVIFKDIDRKRKKVINSERHTECEFKLTISQIEATYRYLLSFV